MMLLVLGSVTVVDEGEVLSLASQRQEQLLALLVCREGRPVGKERLIEELWGDRPGSGQAKNLQVLVHRLRRSLRDPARVRHDRTGYMLVAQTREVDAWHFSDLVRRGRAALAGDDAAEAAALLSEALRLWRGRPFEGLDDNATLAAAAGQLEQDRRRALAARIDADLTLGRHEALVPELVSLLAEDPLSEPTAARLMVALYRAGQRGDAVEVYRRTKAVLRAELGIAPGPHLRELERAVLRGDTDVSPTPAIVAPRSRTPEARPVPRREPGPCSLPADVRDLTGRDRELRALAGALREGTQDGPALCVISGMPGVGKTALAVRAAHQHRDNFPDGQLFLNLHGSGSAAAEPHDALGRLLRALGVRGAALPETLDERTELYRARLTGRRVLVVLDDAAGEGQVEPLTPAAAGCAAVVTSRAPLTALPGAHRLSIGVLPMTAALRLLTTITGRTDLAMDEDAARLATLCGSLPLALRIAGARLAARPHWPVGRMADRLAAEHARLDELTHDTLSVRAGLALGYQGLDDTARTLFRRLGLLDAPTFAGWLPGALLAAGTREGEDVLERLLDAQLAEYAGTDDIGEPRYRMHDLVRLYARERAAVDEPHGEAAATVERMIGAYLSMAERAHRWQYGGDYTIVHGPAARWDVEETTARRLLADPAGWLRSERQGLVAAVEQAARLGKSDACWDLAMTSVTLFEVQGLFDDWRRTSETALALAVRAGDTRGAAAMRYSLGTLELFRQRHAIAGPHLEAALGLFEMAGDRHGQALTLRNAALIDRVRGRTGEALERYERALAMLREVGDRHAEAHVMGSIAQIHIESGRPGSAAPLLGTALAIYREVGDMRGAAQILNRTGALHLAEERAGEAEAAYREVTAVARAGGDRIGEAHGLLGTGQARFLAGDLDGAGTNYAAALALAVDVGEPFVAARARLAAGILAARLGRHDLARSRLEEAERDFAELGMPVWQARAAAARRDLESARRYGAASY